MKDKGRVQQFGTKMLPGIFNGYVLKSGEGWTGDLILAGWHDIDNNIASELHVKRFKPKEVGIKKKPSISISLCRWFPRT